MPILRLSGRLYLVILFGLLAKTDSPCYKYQFTKQRAAALRTALMFKKPRIFRGFYEITVISAMYTL